MHNSFNTKWSAIKTSSEDADEQSLFVDFGKEPITQRQLTLYYCFLFIKNILSEKSAKDVLETGCGRGTLGLYLSKYEGLNLSLLDNEENAITIAKNLFAKYEQKGVFYVRDSSHSDLKNESFDAVVTIGLAEHFPDIDVPQLFKEQYRILKNGGVFVSLNIPQKFSIQFLNLIMRFIKKVLGTYAGDIKKDYFRNSLNPGQYKKTAENVGFKNVYIVRVLPFPLFTPVTPKMDKNITQFYKKILKCKGLFQKYPYRANRFFSRAHFLVGYK